MVKISARFQITFQEAVLPEYGSDEAPGFQQSSAQAATMSSMSSRVRSSTPCSMLTTAPSVLPLGMDKVGSL